MGTTPRSLHAASAVELKERIEAERRGAPFLLYRDGDGVQRILELAGRPSRLTVGRSAETDLSLGWDAEVSRVHAELERVGPTWALADDGLSRNGSFVNEERVAGRRRLADGDVLGLGDTDLAVPRAGTTRHGHDAGLGPQRTRRRRHRHPAPRAAGALSPVRGRRGVRLAGDQPGDRR